MIKYTASLITIGRIIGAFALLLTTPLSVIFYVIYGLCCASDILDGYVARKTKTESKRGEILDSIADSILITILLVIFVPILAFEWWMILWIGVVAVIRIISLIAGFVKFRAYASIHTYANKVTGIIMICFPIYLQLFGITATVFVLCSIASISAFEELIIVIRSKILNRNIGCIFQSNKI
jgi:CDP-diacylglycerol--glycerol-3-phosphate 3-phosphatidyltransferase